MTNPEEPLIRQAQQGDRASFEELVRRTTKLVHARIYLETGDAHRTEDLVQETYFTAFRSIGRLADPASFRPWLFTIAQNAVIDAARRATRLKRTADPATSAEPASTAPPPEERDELRQQALSILRSLPEEYRLPLTMRYLEGADYHTIGLQLGLTNGSLRGLLNRGMELLRAEVKRANGSENLGG